MVEQPTSKPSDGGGRLTLPPDDWSWSVTVGWPNSDIGGEAVRLTPVNGQLLPSRFVLLVKPPEPAGTEIRVVCEVVDGSVTIPFVAAAGVDATRAADVLRKALPVNDWLQLALGYMTIQLLMEQARHIGDPGLVAKILNRNAAESEQALEVLSRQPSGALFNSTRADADALRSDPQWVDALESVRTMWDTTGLKVPGKLPVRKPPPRRNSVTREHLEQVATVYRKAEAVGLPPTKAVSEQLGASHSTAARWVGMARQKGLLGPAQPGRSGEVSPQKVERTTGDTREQEA
jgi:hypothetical protein